MLKTQWTPKINTYIEIFQIEFSVCNFSLFHISYGKQLSANFRRSVRSPLQRKCNDFALLARNEGSLKVDRNGGDEGRWVNLNVIYGRWLRAASFMKYFNEKMQTSSFDYM